MCICGGRAVRLVRIGWHLELPCMCVVGKAGPARGRDENLSFFFPSFVKAPDLLNPHRLHCYLFITNYAYLFTYLLFSTPSQPVSHALQQ